jgi:hypothetical protein
VATARQSDSDEGSSAGKNGSPGDHGFSLSILSCIIAIAVGEAAESGWLGEWLNSVRTIYNDNRMRHR